MTSTLSSVPQALKLWQKTNGLNQKQMAAALAMAPTHYSEVLHGKRQLTRIAMIKAYKLGIPATILLQEPK